LVGHIEGGTEAEFVRRKDAAEDILGTRDEVRGDWRRLHNEVLHDLYFPPDIRVIYSRKEMGWECGTYGRQKRCVKVLMERTEERRPLGKRKSRVEGNTKMDLSDGRRGVDCINLDQDRNRCRAFVNLEINLAVI